MLEAQIIATLLATKQKLIHSTHRNTKIAYL